METTSIRDFFGGPKCDIPMRAVITGLYLKDYTVTFYDRRYNHCEHGQKISAYFLTDLLDHGRVGLCLQGGVPDWTITAAAFEDIYGFIRQIAHILETEVAV